MNISYTAKRIGINGTLNISDEETIINIPLLKKSFKAVLSDDCQPVYGNEIVFIGTFTDDETIEVHIIDDLPCEDVIENIGSFMSILNYKDIYVAALRTELCDVRIEEDSVVVSCKIDNEKVVARIEKLNLEKAGISEYDEDSILDWMYKRSVIILTAKEDSVEVDKENKELVMKKVTFKFC